MAIEVYERMGSRRAQGDNDSNATIETTWQVSGTNDDQEARSYLLSEAPPFYSDNVSGLTLTRSSHSIDQVGFELWDGTVTYSTQARQPSQFSFDTTGGTTHVTQSQGTRKYGSGAPDFNGAVGVTKDGVEGTDIIIPALKFSETHMLPASQVTAGYVATLAGMTGTVNASQWRNFPAESVLFAGATGNSQGDGSVPVTFSFDVGINADNLTIGGIDGIAKKGWEYVWTFYEETEDTTAKRVLKKPKWVFVEQMYRPSDFGVLGI